MLFESERKQLLDVLEDLKRDHFIDAGGGALSLRCDDDRVLMTVTASAFRRWNIGPEDFTVVGLDGTLIEAGSALAASGAPIHLSIYSSFPKARAVLHTHSPYTLVFAALNAPVPSVTNGSDTLGEVPCLYCEDAEVKEAARRNASNTRVPSGIVQRPDVYAVNTNFLIPQLLDKFLQRADELERHGLAFTVYRHGIYLFARTVDETVENLARLEASARTAILSQAVRL